MVEIARLPLAWPLWLRKLASRNASTIAAGRGEIDGEAPGPLALLQDHPDG